MSHEESIKNTIKNVCNEPENSGIDQNGTVSLDPQL
jgi:hypothetical protein